MRTRTSRNLLMQTPALRCIKNTLIVADKQMAVGPWQSRSRLECHELGHEVGEGPISHQDARELIERLAGTIGIQWYLSFILIAAFAISGVSLLTSSNPVSFGDYLALLVLVVFMFLTLNLLVIVYSKPISFDQHGISIGWLWAEKTQYDWDQVVELRNLPFVPGVATLKLSDRKCWPIFMDLDRARHLNDAILIWKSAR